MIGDSDFGIGLPGLGIYWPTCEKSKQKLSEYSRITPITYLQYFMYNYIWPAVPSRTRCRWTLLTFIFRFY